MSFPVSHAQRAPSPPLTDIALCAWIAQADPGDRLEYHRGFLGVDTMPGMSTLPELDRRCLSAVATVALRAFEEGLVHLVQLRIETDRWAYVAIARKRRPGAPIPLATLLPEPKAA